MDSYERSDVFPLYEPASEDERRAFIEWTDMTVEPLITNPAVRLQLGVFLEAKGLLGTTDRKNDQFLIAREDFTTIHLRNRSNGEPVHYDPYAVYGQYHADIALLQEIRPRTKDAFTELTANAYGEAYERLSEINLTFIGQLETEADIAEEIELEVYLDQLEAKLRDPNRYREDARQMLKEIEDRHIVDPTASTSQELVDDLIRLYTMTVLSGKKSLFNQIGTKLDRWCKIELDRDVRDIHFNKAIERYIQGGTTAEDVKEVRDIQGVDPTIMPTIIRSRLMWEVADMLLTQQPKAEQVQEAMIKLMKALGARSMIKDDYTEHTFHTAQAMLEFFNIHLTDFTQESVDATAIDFDPMQLDWEILPPGTLEATAREIVGTSHTMSTPATIDLNRLKILESVRTMWGKDSCYYTRGQLRKRRVLRDSDGTEQPDEYIVLVLQEHDSTGNVQREHVVAESPIAGHNALYVYRQDAAEDHISWRTVMSHTKTKAQTLGARGLTHRVPKDADPIDWMRQKVEQLLTCPPDQFKRIDFYGAGKDGSIRVRLIGAHPVQELVHVEY